MSLFQKTIEKNKFIQKEKHKINDLLKKLLAQKLYKFPRPSELDVPDEHGVYIIYNPDKKVDHVGRSISGRRGLNQRIKNHLHGLSSYTIKHLNGNASKLREGYKFRYFLISDDRERALVEALAIGKLCPEHLGLGSKNSLGKSK